ncbi:MAG: ABC transporter permease [Chloroflexi bacterium]|nr:ABC transporter permease [Chloroflexota bacterium]MBM4247748.1 ABC transporter permease [Deltaproteobacteria bacterium]
MLRNIYHLALKEFLHLVRDRRTLAFLILMPSVLTVIFGYAIGSPRVTGIPTRIVDLDGGRITEEYEEALNGSVTFRPEVVREATDDDVAAAEEALRRDDISAFVVIPKGLSDTVEDGGSGTVRAVVDASDTFTAPSVLRELGSTTVQQNAFLAAERARREGRADSVEDGLRKVAPIELATEMRFNPELKSQNFVMPGVIGLILQILTVIVMATSIARERERGTMEQLAVTPLTPPEIFIGKLLPYFFLALLDTVNVMLLAWLLFGVALQGHFVVVAALVVTFILGSLGIGQLISVVSRNQSQAVQLAVFYILPAFVLSGAFTPIETQPEAVRPIAYAFPLTYFCHGFRAALLRQATLHDVRWDLAAMLAFVLLTFGLSVLLLRARPDAR